MNDDDLMFEVDMLGMSYVRVPGGVRCVVCKRGWKTPNGEALSQANFDFLCEHAEEHVRELRQAVSRETP